MSTPVEWKTGDVITAERLNATLPLIIHAVDSDPAAGPKGGLLRDGSGESSATEKWLDKTWQEINDAAEAGRPVYLIHTETLDAENGYFDKLFAKLAGVGSMSEAYMVVFEPYGIEFGASSPSGYPVF